MKRDEFIKCIKENLESQQRQIYSEIVRDCAHDLTPDELAPELYIQGEDLTESLRVISEIETIGDAFKFMRDYAYGVEGAVATALNLLIEDARKDEYYTVPLRGWDTQPGGTGNAPEQKSRRAVYNSRGGTLRMYDRTSPDCLLWAANSNLCNRLP